ncbi:MAG: hypothetical protein ACYC1Q_11330 [Bacteroidia bacterium]
MKCILFSLLSLLITNNVLSQNPDLSKVSSENTWFKVGLNAGIPLQPTSSSFVLGLDASIQFLETKASGIGIKSGYSYYFTADNNLRPIGEIPLAIMYRFYPTSTGFFTGLDIGYSFIVDSPNTKGGFMGRPHAGYHGYNWNIYAYYNLVLIQETDQDNIQSVGIALTRNIRLRGSK